MPLLCLVQTVALLYFDSFVTFLVKARYLRPWDNDFEPIEPTADAPIPFERWQFDLDPGLRALWLFLWNNQDFDLIPILFDNGAPLAVEPFIQDFIDDP